jgi:hypothetical protein
VLRCSTDFALCVYDERRDVNIPDLAEALNRAAPRFEIGRLQQLRVRLRALERSPAASIFDARTIKPDYAFHVGGGPSCSFYDQYSAGQVALPISSVRDFITRNPA